MTIIALDPGFGRLGLAVLTKDKNKETVLYSTCLITSSKLSFPERLNTIIKEVKMVINKFPVQCLVLEKLYFAKNKTTALQVAEVRGALLNLAMDQGLTTAEYDPTAVKIAVTGYGRADKTQVTTMVKRLVNLSEGRRYDDELDAIALGLTHLSTIRV